MLTDRKLLASDPYCPKCGHNRDTSSISSISYGVGVAACQLCDATWDEIEAEVRAEVKPQGCTRSHPHENMSAECEAKTVEARRVFWEAQEPAPLDESHYCPDCEALQANVAELKEKMFSESAEFVHFMQIDHPKALGERDSTIAQQAERIAGLETRLEENAMPDDYILMADKLSAQDVLIEKCERCLQDLSGMGWADEALAAIAAHRGKS